MKRKVLFICVFIIMIIVFFLSFKTSNAESIIDEEASPIREDNEIVGMDYSITIGEDTNKDNIIINTAIISSIIHYKDIKFISDFFIDLKIINKSNYEYSLKNISINNGESIKKKIDYKTNNSIISFYLNKDDLIDTDNYVLIELEK